MVPIDGPDPLCRVTEQYKYAHECVGCSSSPGIIIICRISIGDYIRSAPGVVGSCGWHEEILSARIS